MPVYKLIALRVNNEVAMGMPYYAQNRLPLRNKDFTINNEPKEEVYGLTTFSKLQEVYVNVGGSRTYTVGFLYVQQLDRRIMNTMMMIKGRYFRLVWSKAYWRAHRLYCLSITNPAIMLSSSINTFLNKPTARTIAKQVRVI